MNSNHSKFLRHLSHDLKSPINSIIGFSDILDQDLNENQKIINYTIRNSGVQMLHTLTNYVNLSALEGETLVEKVKTFSVSELIYKVLNMFQQPNDDLIEINVAGDYEENDFVNLDYKIAHDILFNIISNAIKFTEKGEINIVFTIQDNFVKFSVSDTGFGISNEELPHIYEKNWRGKNPVKIGHHAGTGIGLTVAKGLVKFLKGDLNISSSLNVGTQVEFSLPHKTDNFTGYTINRESKKMDLKGAQIIIADDDFISYQLLATQLKQINGKVTHAANGQELIEMMKSNTYDAAIVDMNMPVVDGPEAVRQIRLFDQSTKIIALTANILQKAKEEALSAGCNDFISKPIDINILYSIIIHP